MIPVERSMKGSGAPGNRRRAAARSPPCRSGSSAPPEGIMSVALALLAMLIELCSRLSATLLRAIGHPVTWIGSLIGVLDRFAQPRRGRTGQPADRRHCRSSGSSRHCRVDRIRAAARAVSSAVRHLSPWRFSASTLIAQRSLHRHVADVAAALETGGVERRPRRSIAHRRPRYRNARRSRRRPRGDRKPRGEFLRRDRGAGAVDGHCRAPWRRTLQGDQHRRQHDRPPHAALRGLRLGGGPARRSRQSAGVAARGASPHRRGGVA